MKRQKIIITCVVIVLLILASVPTFASEVISTEKIKISIGYCPFGMLETSVAKAQAFYKTYLPNVEVEWVFGLYSIELINKWVAGDLEIAYLGDMPAVILQDRVKNTKWVSAAVYPHGEVATLYVPHTSTLTSIKELDGKQVATAMGSSHHRILDVIAVAEGITLHLKHYPPAEALEKLKAGEVEAFLYWPPYVELVKHENAGKVLVEDFTQYEPEVNSIWPFVVSEEFAEKHPEIVRGLVKADQDLHAFMREHPDEAAEIVYRELEGKIPLPVLKGSLASYQYADGLEQEHIDAMQRDIDFLKEKKLIKDGFSAAEWADPSFIK